MGKGGQKGKGRMGRVIGPHGEMREEIRVEWTFIPVYGYDGSGRQMPAILGTVPCIILWYKATRGAQLHKALWGRSSRGSASRNGSGSQSGLVSAC